MASMACSLEALGLPRSFGKTSMASGIPEIDATKKEAEAKDEKRCKYCKKEYPAIMFAPKQWQKNRPTCYGCCEKLRKGEKMTAGNEEIENEITARLSAVKQQLEYYFGHQNWSKDTYLRSLANPSSGAVPLNAVIAFPRLAEMLKGQHEVDTFVSRALQDSKIVSLTPDGFCRILNENSIEKKRKREPAISTLEIDDEEEKRRAQRAHRFVTQSQDAAITVNISGHDQSVSSELFFIGTSRRLEKSYLRLTSAPRPEDVRPHEVLKLALEHVVSRYQQDEDYTYACDQLKAIRQDLTVQNITTIFAAQVYQAHARIALAEADFNEYAQCQSRLIEIHAQEPADNVDPHMWWHAVIEFAAYRLLYSVATTGPRSLEANRALQKILDTKAILPSTINPAPIDHALAVVSALNLEQYQAFFALYHSTPNAGAFLLDGLLPVLRKRAYMQIKRAFLPGNKTIPLNRIATALGFDNEPEQCRAYLTENTDGALLSLLH